MEIPIVTELPAARPTVATAPAEGAVGEAPVKMVRYLGQILPQTEVRTGERHHELVVRHYNRLLSPKHEYGFEPPNLPPRLHPPPTPFERAKAAAESVAGRVRYHVGNTYDNVSESTMWPHGLVVPIVALAFLVAALVVESVMNGYAKKPLTWSEKLPIWLGTIVGYLVLMGISLLLIRFGNAKWGYLLLAVFSLFGLILPAELAESVRAAKKE